MVAARLTIAFSRSVRSAWQLLALSSGCGFAAVAGLIGVYVLTMYFASWDPGGYAVPYPVLTHNFLASRLQVLAGVGALMAGATLGLWLLREGRDQERNSAVGEPGATTASVLSPVAPHERALLRSRQLRAEEHYFWLSVLVGPVVVIVPLIFLEMIFSPETALGAPKLLWAVLRYYYGGTYAAAISAALVLALVSNRSRCSAWLVAFFVGLHVGAIFTLLFDYADDTVSNQALLLPFGGLVGALSAAICTVIWFPDRRGLGEQSTQQATSVRGLMRGLLIAGFAAPAAAALSHGLFAAAAYMLGSAPQRFLDSGMQVGAAETWLLNYRLWAVVALMTMLLDHILKNRAVRSSVAVVTLSLSAFLVGGGMAHSLNEDILWKVVPISVTSFLVLGLSSVVAGLSAVFLIRRGPSFSSADAESVAA
ncbi:hypothetical protein AC244_33505 [Ensifer adhaerens]|uniref:Uncharacterized protein n=2 Tax=Ensifer adhaerens TaxID=106592 RepID=A0A0L8BCZ4_ENSAD|nr:hypothetical protein AC244_33505 [Ensifer adhaerens]